MSLRRKTISGITWSAASQVGRQAILFIVGVILVRLLSPREFGLVAMVTVITGFASIFAELGLSAALVQKRDVRSEHLSSVFWVNIAAGITLTALFVLGAPLIAGFYGEPMLLSLTMVIALSFVIQSTAIVQRTLLSKALDFRRLSFAEIGAATGAGIIAITMALAGFGVWSLVAKSIVSAVIMTTTLWLMSDWRPAMSFSWASVKELLGFSSNLLGEKTLNYWVRNIDNLLIGKVLGSGSLGIYSRAYAIMLFPLRNISGVIARVLFPALSTIQQDKQRVKRAFLRVVRVISLITFPLMLGLFVTAESFVLAVFGQQWSEMIPILRILCFIGVAQSIVTLVGSLFLSQGRADLQFRLGLFIKPMLIMGIVIGLNWGIVGVAIGYAAAVTVAQYLNLRFAGSLVDISYSEVLLELSGAFLCAATMGVCVYGVGHLLPQEWGHFGRLAVQVPAGIIIYLILVHGFKLRAYSEVRNLLAERVATLRAERSLPATSES